MQATGFICPGKRYLAGICFGERTMIEEYLWKFSKLNTYKSHKTWTNVTAYQAPHKPFLLLSIMDLIEQVQIKTRTYLKIKIRIHGKAQSGEKAEQTRSM